MDPLDAAGFTPVGAKHYSFDPLWKDFDVYDAFDVLGPQQS